MKKTFLFLTIIGALALFFIIFNPNQARAVGPVDCSVTATTGVPQSECLALMDLYTNLTGTGWNHNINWNTASAVSTWYGVTVAGGHVTSISFIANNVLGSLPTSIGNLTSLTTLEIRGEPGLTGSIPVSVGNLISLTTFNLSNNGNLTGTIPTEVGNLVNLQYFYVNNCNLTGTIPAGLANWTNIVHIFVSSNHLTGSIPAGLSSTLRYLWVNNNNLSGTVPAYLADIPLTNFWIHNNNFLPSNMETRFTDYCSGNREGFVYSPQNGTETYSSASKHIGDSLTISSTITTGGSDVYQWYKSGVIIPGANLSSLSFSSLTYGDASTYSYKITNPIVTGLTIESAGYFVGIMRSDPPTPDSIYYILDGNDTWVRGSISDNEDMAQKYILRDINNHELTFGEAYALPKETLDTVNAYQSGALWAFDSTDDVTPIYTNNVGYVGSEHGFVAPVVTSAEHDKSSEDIGSEWIASDGAHYILAAISGDNLTFYSVSYPNDDYWMVNQIIAGTTLTNFSGGVHTSNINIDSQQQVQQFPITKNMTHHILVNGTTEATSEGFANFLDFVEEYDLVDPSTLNTANNPFIWNDGEVWIHVKNVYRATGGTTILHTTYNVKRPMRLGYMGFLQTSPLPWTWYMFDHQYYYIPKTKPIGDYNFKNIQQFDTDSLPGGFLNFNSDYMDNPNSPPNRQIIFGNYDGEESYEAGFAFGYSPYLSTADENRHCADYLDGCWMINASSGKTYPIAIADQAIGAGTTYEMYGYRQWLDPTIYDANKSVYWNNQNGHDLVYIDYHRSADNELISLPSRFVGKSIRVLDSENMSSVYSEVAANGLKVSTTGENTYGFLVLELYTQTPTVTSSGGGGGSSYIPPVLPIPVTPKPAPAPTPAPNESNNSNNNNQNNNNSDGLTKEILTINLYQGLTNQQVKLLQKILNDNGFIVATKGAGSPGQETTFFGANTKRAVMQFQKKNKIKPVSGLVGPLTRKLLNNLIK